MTRRDVDHEPVACVTAGAFRARRRLAWWDLRPLDRALLEDVILARFASRPNSCSVLFIGVARGQRRYEALFAGHRFVTVDSDPAGVRHGSSQCHRVACASELIHCFDAGSFDVAVMNGVIGWGLNEEAKADRAISGLHQLLRAGGELVLGWNERRGRRPFNPLALPALQSFEVREFDALGASVFDVPGWRRHRYAFFRRPSESA